MQVQFQRREPLTVEFATVLSTGQPCQRPGLRAQAPPPQAPPLLFLVVTLSAPLPVPTEPSALLAQQPPHHGALPPDTHTSPAASVWLWWHWPVPCHTHSRRAPRQRPHTLLIHKSPSAPTAKAVPGCLQWGHGCPLRQVQTGGHGSAWHGPGEGCPTICHSQPLTRALQSSR